MKRMSLMGLVGLLSKYLDSSHQELHEVIAELRGSRPSRSAKVNREDPNWHHASFLKGHFFKVWKAEMWFYVILFIREQLEGSWVQLGIAVELLLRSSM